MKIFHAERSRHTDRLNALAHPVLCMALAVMVSGCKPSAPPVSTGTAIPVRTQVIELRHIKDIVLLDGTIAPSQQVNLVARVAGNLDSIHFKDGQWVKKGELLFTIERPPYLDQLKLNQAKLDQAKSDYDRQKELLKENANSETNVETSLSNLRQAEANVDLAKINLSYTEIRAPFAGIMGKRLVDAGNYVGSQPGGTVLGTIMQISPVYINAAVGENEALRIRDQRAKEGKRSVTDSVGKIKTFALLQGESEASETGVLDFVDHALNQTSGTVAVRGVFENSQRHLIPGFYAQLGIEASEGRDALVIRKSIIQTDQEGDYVFVVGSDHIAHRRTITTTLLPKEEVEVTKGLKVGDTVVTEGYARLAEGLTVELSNPTAGK